MDAQFWQQRWEAGQTGFHLDRPNPHLAQHFERLQLAPGAQVFVPLCGKSLDMVWLAERGVQVVGVELSERAVHDFFAAQDLDAQRVREAGLDVWRNGPYTLYCGDYFQLEPAQLSNCAAFYDRAALIALPSEMRARYVEQLRSLMPPGHRGLLVSVEYEQTRMDGPPFAVPETEVSALYAPYWNLERLAAEDNLGDNPRFADRGLQSFWEKVFLLRTGGA